MQYICSFIFKELMGVDFKITIDSEEFKNYDGVKINYSDVEIQNSKPARPAGGFKIQNYSLLFDEIIIAQEIICFDSNGTKAFFRTHNSDFPFDIFAASFYLITRYEEHLPHEKDMYGRYAHENSLSFREGFLNLPLINLWVKNFTEKLKEKFSMLNVQRSMFNFEPTYDIDIAYSYKHKGILRNIGGFLKSPSAERIKVLAGLQKDPFDSYGWLHNLHQQYNLKPLYFFLVAEKNEQYDKNILPQKNAMWKLVKQHAKKYRIGLHPSWQSGDNLSLLKKEKEQLGAMADTGQATWSGLTSISNSRQHYIRFNLPEGYSRLIEAGITDDYSMGYGSINGFRASVASSFFWYNLEKEEQTTLRIHPFCFMDANSYYEQKQTSQQTMTELIHYLAVCKEVNGTLITIWHNNFLGATKEFDGWKDIYEKFIIQVQR
ncbi:MAG: polysaccharide deacetylase family protein [Ferruginibacter sp.]